LTGLTGSGNCSRADPGTPPAVLRLSWQKWPCHLFFPRRKPEMDADRSGQCPGGIPV